jgi:hypothetical protein
MGLLTCGACGGAQVTCTDIGAPSGVNVTIDRQIAADIHSLTLTICWAPGNCVDHLADLAPGADSVDQGCNGSAPDAACSATAVPNGSKIGFVPAELPAGKITIEATVVRNGRQRTFGPLDVDARTTYPNGPACPAGGNQATITLGRDGLR